MRRIIICADGTWNEPDQYDDNYDVRKPTNVTKFARAVVPTDTGGISQIVHYDVGIGTHDWYDKIVGGISGKGISANIIEAYRFLVHNYSLGDEIFFFGFSRGAFTVRSLAGLVNAIGLLPKNQQYWLPEAYDLYRSGARSADVQSFQRLNNCRQVPVKMVGVWDTVGALGIPIIFLDALTRRQHRFHNVALPKNVENAFHAVAIDEDREAFKPTLWDNRLQQHQHVEQAWFPGVHSNIGGGYKDDGLANCALHWMVDKAVQLGVEVDRNHLKHYRPFPGDTLYASRTGIFRLGRRHSRRIGITKYGNETVHESAITRWQSTGSKYRPANLRRYLESQRSGLHQPSAR